MNMNTVYSIFYAIIVVLFIIFSYGFVDLNLTLSDNAAYAAIAQPLSALVFQNRQFATIIYATFLAALFGLYLHIVWGKPDLWQSRSKTLLKPLLSIVFSLFLAYPAVSYDVFNYISTAKVAFAHRENPYLTMPIEIPHEPFNSFTRAANKTALYGPVWILLTAVPWVVSGGHIWRAILSFKLLMGVVYLLYIYLIYIKTKSLRNVLFFALNPLIIIEVLVSGHNDLVMMLLAISGFFLWKSSSMLPKVLGAVLFISSWFIKGSTVLLTPLLFLTNLTNEKLLKIAYWVMLILFIVATPLREELYPWYAVWFISIISMLPITSNGILFGFTVALSIGLELRHLPYMWMGYYEGPGPVLRIALTILPVALYFLFQLPPIRKYKRL